MDPFKRIIPARRSLRNYLLLILAVTAFVLAHFLFPQVRSASAWIIAAGNTASSVFNWILLGIGALALLFLAIVWLLVFVLRAHVKREKIRLGLHGEKLQLPTDPPPPLPNETSPRL